MYRSLFVLDINQKQYQPQYSLTFSDGPIMLSHYHGASVAFWISRIWFGRQREPSPVLISHMQLLRQYALHLSTIEAVSHSRDEFWWDASQRSLTGSAKKSRTDARNRTQTQILCKTQCIQLYWTTCLTILRYIIISRCYVAQYDEFGTTTMTLHFNVFRIKANMAI